jgi:hypothetical protein
MARVPGNNALFEQRISAHFDIINQHYALMYRVVNMLENISNDLLLGQQQQQQQQGDNQQQQPDNNQQQQNQRTYAEATFSAHFPVSENTQRTSSQNTTMNNENAADSRVNRSTDELLQGLVSSILNPRPRQRDLMENQQQPLRQSQRDLRENQQQPLRQRQSSLSEIGSIFSLFSPPVAQRGVYEFEATFPIHIPMTPDIEPPLNLTAAEVDEHTEIVEYNSSNTTMTETRCPITYEDFTEGEAVRRIRFCKHYFKSNAITDWLRNTRGSCPVCRHILLDDDDQQSVD